MKRTTLSSTQSTADYATSRGKAYILLCYNNHTVGGRFWYPSMKQPHTLICEGGQIAEFLNKRIREAACQSHGSK